MPICTALSYTPYATSSSEKTGNITTFTQFQEEDYWFETQNLLSKTRNGTESGNKYDNNSTMPPLISEEEMDAMS